MSGEPLPVVPLPVSPTGSDSDAEAVAARVRYLFRMVDGSPEAAELQAMVLAYRLAARPA